MYSFLTETNFAILAKHLNCCTFFTAKFVLCEDANGWRKPSNIIHKLELNWVKLNELYIHWFDVKIIMLPFPKIRAWLPKVHIFWCYSNHINIIMVRKSGWPIANKLTFDHDLGQVEWMSEKIIKAFEDQRNNPFQFKPLQQCHNLAELQRLPDPKVSGLPALSSILPNSNLSLSHTHTHTHTYSLSLSLSLSRSFYSSIYLSIYLSSLNIFFFFSYCISPT